MTENIPEQFDLDWFQENVRPSLSAYAQEFSDTEYGRELATYVRRLKGLGLSNVGTVLDAGGGIANWAIPLAVLNRNVDVVDISSERLLVGQMIAARMKIDNLRFRHASIDSLPYPDESFDAVFCYSVIMFTEIDKTLREFNRVLRPGGKLYIMTDLWRWYIGQGMPEVSRARYFASLCIARLRFARPKFLSARGVNDLINATGFRIIDSGQDGQSSFVDTQGSPRSNHFYAPKDVGKEEIWEVCAIKS